MRLKKTGLRRNQTHALVVSGPRVHGRVTRWASSAGQKSTEKRPRPFPSAPGLLFGDLVIPVSRFEGVHMHERVPGGKAQVHGPLGVNSQPGHGGLHAPQGWPGSKSPHAGLNVFERGAKVCLCPSMAAGQTERTQE